MDSQPRYSEPKPRELQLPLRCDPVPLPRSPSKTFAPSHRANPNPTLFRPASRVGCQDIAFLYIMQLGLSRGWGRKIWRGLYGRWGGASWDRTARQGDGDRRSPPRPMSVRAAARHTIEPVLDLSLIHISEPTR